MADFFDGMDFDDVGHMEQLSRLIFEFRMSRDVVLKQYEVADAAALLEKIKKGQVEEHPAYEHYLSLKILDDMRETLRSELKDFLPKVRPA